MQLKDKVAIVTGAGRGIGAVLARQFGREGANVVVHHLEEPEAAAAIASEFGPRAICVQGDLGQAQSRGALVRAALESFGHIDILVNNAGLDPGPTEFFDMDETSFDAIVGINVKAMYFCTQAVAKKMVCAGRGGRIVNISSIQAEQTVPKRSVYATTKGAVNAMTRQLALDLAPHGITVNAIAPGFIEVERISSRSGYDRGRFASAIPLGRVGVPHDVASLCAFLASDAAAFLTGQVITLDGGSACRLWV